LVGIGSTESFSYDGAGNRLRAVRNGVEVRYIYDANGNLLAEADSSNTITRYYVHGAGLLAAITPAGDLYCYHYDGVGNTVAITDASETVVNSYDYSPFGMILTESEIFAQPFKFVGKLGVMAESNGFYYMRARYYDPVVGRFISEDPLGFDGGDVNLYVYGSNNPLLVVDPFGLESNNSWATYGANGVITGEIGIEANPAIDPIEIVVGAGAARRLYQEGSEFVIRRSGRQVARIAPFGNRTGHRLGRYLHYHRRGRPGPDGQTPPGQGIGRHRPWERSRHDTSWRDRF